MAELYSIVWNEIEGLKHLYPFCFLTLAIVNNATMNTGMRVSFQISDFVFFGYTRSGNAESHGSSISSFFEKPPYFFPQ